MVLLAFFSDGVVGFSAYLSSDSVLPEDSALIFDRVLSNFGEGYNEFAGFFIPPVDGLYLLTLNIGN